jgi:hypothetical protein
MAEKREPGDSKVEIHACIDRIEDGDWAVVLLGEDEEVEIDWPVSMLPEGARGGDHLRITIALDRESRAAAEDRIRKLREELEKQSGTQGQKDFKL